MKYTVLIAAALLLLACSNDSEKVEKTDSKKTEVPTDNKATNPDDLVEINGNTYTEYYDESKSQIKQTGDFDADQKRHGIWKYYHRNGVEASMTEYNHGEKNGISIVRRPNGTPYYHGEYKDDKKVGIWKTFDEEGKLVTEKEY